MLNSYENYEDIYIKKYQLISDNNEIGYFEYSIIENNCIYIEYIYVHPKYRGKGYGNELVKLINNFIEREGKFGILQNSLDSNYLYEKNKWKETDNSIFFSYGTQLKEESKKIIDRIITYQI